MSQFNKIFGCIQQFNYVITDEIGIHARPAGMLAKANGKAAEVTKLMAVMQLGVKKGAEITVTAEGEDEDVAIAKIEAFMKENL